MTNYKNYIVTAIIALVVSLVVVAVYPSSQSNVELGGLIQKELTIANANISGNGSVTTGGGVLRINQTGATRTLTDAEMYANSEIVIDSTTSAALALTLPVSTDMKLTIPKVGQSKNWVIQNNHSNAATTTTITTNTGINLQGDTANDDVINGAVTGTLTCRREYDLSVLCIVSEKVNAE